MQFSLRIILCLISLSVAVRAADEAPEFKTDRPAASGGDKEASASAEVFDKNTKLLRISIFIDGSGRIIFSDQGARYEHGYWERPEDIIFDGQQWTDLTEPAPTSREMAGRLDLTKARIVKRKGRDVIALEITREGFDLIFADSPNGGSLYEVTIAIPRRK